MDIWDVKSPDSVVSSCLDLSHSHAALLQGFHLGLWPNLNPPLILNGADIVLKSVYCTPFLQWPVGAVSSVFVSLLHSLSPIVYGSGE